MTPFEKGAEDVFEVLGVRSPGVVSDLKEKVVEGLPEPIKDVKEQLGKSYRATPYSLLFGRYKDTLGNMVKKVKEKAQGLVD